MALLLKALAGISAAVLLIGSLLGSVLALGGLLLGAVKVLIVTIFVALLIFIIFSMLRDRTRKRNVDI
jgi:hypothetical protein